MHCQACGHEVRLAPGERVAFRDECGGCRADLHACRNCAHHDPTAYNHCREPDAERVLDSDRANRCDYFRPATGVGATADAGGDARSKLEDLFRK